jgi:cyclomaltodextrin glucanotransferase
MVEEMQATDEELEVLQLRDIEFRGDVIYFIVVDRFHDGDPNNSAVDKELYDPTRKDWGKYWGGDLQGVIDKLDYLQALGVTAVWLTPLFEQIHRMAWQAAPIHGYWTGDFKRINARWVAGTQEVRLFEHDNTTFDRLVAEMHRRHMKLVLDIVCNHSSPEAGGVKGQLFDDGKLVADFNNDKDHWYHHYGEVKDWEDEWQIQNCELAGLATFNENNIRYRNYIKDAIRKWLDKGVDALRIDTAKHMPIWFWQEFTSDMTAHKPQTFMFGEWIYSHPSSERSVTFANQSGMSILDFALCVAIRVALGKNDAKGFHLVQEIYDQDHVYRGATELVTFIDNHDMPRFLSLGTDGDAMRLALDLIMTGRGIPCLYYGTEQYLHNDTEGGNDPYNRPMMDKWDQTTPVFKDIQRLAHLRRRNPAIRLGRHAATHVTPDVYCFARVYRDSRCFVAMNRGGATTLADVGTEMPDGTHRCLLTGREIRVEGGHCRDLQLGAKEVLVLSVIGKPVRAKVVARAQLNGVVTKPGEFIAMTGDCPELGNWDLTQAKPLEYINANTWFGEIPFDASAGTVVSYKYVLLRDSKGQNAPQRENQGSRRRHLPESGAVKWRDVWEE